MNASLDRLDQLNKPSEFVEHAKSIIDVELASILDALPQWEAAPHISQIVRYAVFAGGGGKRIRPALALLTARCMGTPYQEVLEAAAAIELIHTYTLIIDDIQDGDELRRDVPATHVKYGTNLSLLAASTLLIEGTSRLQAQVKMPPAMLRQILHKLHAGQEADIESEHWSHSNRSVGSVEFIFSGKSGALFELSCVSAAGSRRMKTQTFVDLARIGSEMGIIFQAVDDYLEVADDKGQTGKPVRKDRGNKLTFMNLFSNISEAKQAIYLKRADLEIKIQKSLGENHAIPLIDFLTVLVDRTR